MSKNRIRNQAIKMAFENPHLREKMLPLIQKLSSQEMAYGHKERHGSFFLTAFALRPEEMDAFKETLNTEMVKLSLDYWRFPVTIRLSKEEKGVLVVWWDYDWREAARVWGEDEQGGSPSNEAAWGISAGADEAIEKAARKHGYRPKRLYHAADVKPQRTASDEGEEEAKAGPSKKPGGKFIQFMEEMGDEKVRNPDTGNDVKLKSLKGEKGKKLQHEKFEKWLASQEKSKGKSDEKGGKPPAKSEGTKDKGPDNKPSGGSAAKPDPKALDEVMGSKYHENNPKEFAEVIKGLPANAFDDEDAYWDHAGPQIDKHKAEIKKLESESKKEWEANGTKDHGIVWEASVEHSKSQSAQKKIQTKIDILESMGYDHGVIQKALKGGKKASLRAQVIKLAHEHPELRADLLPLLQQAKTKSKE